MSWSRTVTVTGRKLSDQERARLQKLNVETPALFKMRCDHIDSNGKACTLRAEGSHDYVTRVALAHTHEHVRLEERVRWTKLAVCKPFNFTEGW